MNNKKAKKLVDRKRNTDGSPFEDTMILPASGGRAARCQATTKAGEQCGKAAREGYTVCSSHGAGTRRREQNGSRQKPGRPATRGRYSATASQRIREFAEEMRALGVDHWDDIDELLVLRAALKWSL